ncbi:hypothetical protein L6452_19170 [Arctium lappa]|uniref:Uncharacterized protein n=1 Tax=Arctium lappa TaxID=4217 RepID=A0ACB9B923_ARCLA|nr:hypothetical protein L6452_19170 [Arctium lappa]
MHLLFSVVCFSFLYLKFLLYIESFFSFMQLSFSTLNVCVCIILLLNLLTWLVYDKHGQKPGLSEVNLSYHSSSFTHFHYNFIFLIESFKCTSIFVFV